MNTFTQEELDMIQYRIDDPDWDISQQGDLWEMLPRLLQAAAELSAYRPAVEECDLVVNLMRSDSSFKLVTAARVPRKLYWATDTEGNNILDTQ